MLPSRALCLPAHAHDDARIIELLNLCASRQLFTPTPLHIGVVPGAVSTSAPLLLLIKPATPAQIAAWSHRLHAHEMSAALLVDDPALFSTTEWVALAGLGLWPVFTGGKPPLISLTPTQIDHALDVMKPAPHIIAPHANSLSIATDDLLLSKLARRDITHVIVPELQLSGLSHPNLHIIRRKEVDLDHETSAAMLAWLEGDRKEVARSGIRALGKTLRRGATDLRRRSTRKR